MRPEAYNAFPQHQTPVIAQPPSVVYSSLHEEDYSLNHQSGQQKQIRVFQSSL